MLPNDDYKKILQDQLILLSEVMLKLSSIENLLVEKKILSVEEITNEIKTLTEKLSHSFAEQINKNSEEKLS